MTFPMSTIIALPAGAHMSFPTGHKAPTLVCLHYLGGSRQTWSWMAGALGGAADLLAIDLPGFGDAAGSTGYTVAEMANAVAARIAKAGPQRFVLCGHSMGAKVAITLAHRASQGSSELDGLVGLALLAGSPPGPEPMQESKRQEMQGWCAGGEKMTLASAAAFVAQNVGGNLPPDRQECAVADARRCNPVAWRAWLECGSREDWAHRIGVLEIPALIVSGAEDAALGEAAQHHAMTPHFVAPRVATLTGAGHLLPLERPTELATLIGETFLAPVA